MGELINIADIEQFFPEGTDREQLACLTKQINHFFKKDTTNITWFQVITAINLCCEQVYSQPHK